MRDGAAIAAALGGRRVSKCWLFFCPAHNDRQKLSAAIRDDGLVTCFAGCARRDVLAALDALGFVDDEKLSTASAEDIAAIEAKRIADARQMWDEAIPGYWFDDPIAKAAHIESVAHYLRSRGIITPVPDVLRRWRNGFMAAVQQLDGTITAIHTKSPAREGRNQGPMYRGAVQLAAPIDGQLGLAESVFDAMSATQLTGVPCWSTCGAPRLGAIDLPSDVTNLTLFSDNDDAGRAAAELARREYIQRRRDVRVWPPGDGVKDWNEKLQKRIKPNGR